MKFPALISLVLSAVLLSGCAMGGPKKVVKEEPPRLMLVGVDKIPGDMKTSPVFVSFEGSQAMTSYLRDAFAKHGFVMTPEKADARYSLLVGGHFTSKGKINIPRAELGPIFDRAEAALDERDYTRSSFGEGITTPAFMGRAGDIFGPGYMNIVGFTLFGALSDATGISGRFNQLVVGDPRGLCISDCEDREFNRQHARVEALLFEGETELARFGRAAEAYQPNFIPQELIHMALEGTVNAVLDGAAQ